MSLDALKLAVLKATRPGLEGVSLVAAMNALTIPEVFAVIDQVDTGASVDCTEYLTQEEAKSFLTLEGATESEKAEAEKYPLFLLEFLPPDGNNVEGSRRLVGFQSLEPNVVWSGAMRDE